MRPAELVLPMALALGLAPGIASACHPMFNETWGSQLVWDPGLGHVVG